MGKFDEALSVCLNAKELLYKNEANLMDDLTLSTLQIVFQRLITVSIYFMFMCLSLLCQAS